jgi:serine/threonine-protein kinase
MSRAGGGKRKGWLAERFEKLKRIGEGAMAEVWLATDHGSKPFAADRRVALKIPKPFVAEDRDALARFEFEGKAMSEFDHPNIAKVFKPMRDGPDHFLVMEHISGRSLADVLENRKSLPPEDAIEIIGQVCAGVGYAHAQGIIHRDIKPGNVMLEGGYRKGRSPRVKVTDFGIARAKEGTRITRTGSVVGTPAYMPAEVMKGGTATVRSDVYACGAMLYRMLTGRLPFDGAGLPEVLEQQEAGPPRPPAELAPAVTGALSEATMVALRRNHAARYQDVESLSRAVEAAWKGEDFRAHCPKQRTGVTHFLPRTGWSTVPPPDPWARPWLTLLLFAASLGALALMLQIFVRLTFAIAELPIWAIAAPVVAALAALALARSPLFSDDFAKRSAARDRLRTEARSSAQGVLVGVLAGYWAILGYHLASTVKDAIGRQAQASHMWLEIGSAAIWIAVALFPLRWLLRARMPLSRLLVAGSVLVLAWTAGAELFPRAPGTVAPAVWGHPSPQERVRAEGKRWTDLLGRPSVRAAPADRTVMRVRLRRNAVLRALRRARGQREHRLAKRRARRWIRSMRRARVAWRRPGCHRGSRLSIHRGGARVACL